MTTNLQNSPYLQKQRNFPTQNSQALGVELDHAYIDIANKVNDRTVGLFSANLPSITGESWYVMGQPNRQQTLRRAYPFTTTAAIPHGIDFSQITYITRMYGQYTDNTNWYGLIPASNVAIPGQISFYLTPTNITFVVGAGAPTLTKGIIVIEWLSQI